MGFTDQLNKEIIIRSIKRAQQEEETMNDNLNTPATEDLAFHKDRLLHNISDEEFAKLVAAKPLDGEVLGYVTDADETDDEAQPKPTIH